MAPQQNTFSVISAGPGRAGGAPSRPPMTSKQAQKLYKQATKEPRRSKAEQRKWEKERQEEIRKELEKERAAAKARMARERKKAKEDEARENRRRAGEPLFNCRPSQDTIARFVRGNGTNKKRDSSGEPTPEAEEASVASSETKPPPPPALASKPNPHALANQSESSQGHEHSINSTASPPRPAKRPMLLIPPPQTTSPHLQRPLVNGMLPPPPRPAPKCNPSIPATSLPLALKPLVSAPAQPPVATSMGPPPKPAPKSKPRPFMMPRVALAAQQPARHKMFKHIAPTAQSALSSPEAPLPQNPMLQNPMPQKPPSQKPPSQKPPSQKPPSQKPPSQKPQSEMPELQKPQLQKPPLEIPAPQMPPPSTQAIVQDCFDDFFPTASQLAMELEEDDKSDDYSQAVVNPWFSHPSPPDASLDDPAGLSIQPRRVGSTAPKDDKDTVPGKSSGDSQGARTNGEATRSTGHPRLLNARIQEPSRARARTRLLGDLAPTIPKKEAHGLGREGPQDQDSQPLRRGMHQQTTSARPMHHQSIDRTGNALTPKTAHTPAFPAYQNSAPKRGILQEIDANRAPPSKLAATAKASPQLDFFPLICTQDLMMSSQEVLDIESPAKTTSQPSSSGGSASKPSPLIEMELAAIDWDDDLDDF